MCARLLDRYCRLFLEDIFHLIRRIVDTIQDTNGIIKNFKKSKLR